MQQLQGELGGRWFVVIATAQDGYRERADQPDAVLPELM
jgi:hypothetical protein